MAEVLPAIVALTGSGLWRARASPGLRLRFLGGQPRAARALLAGVVSGFYGRLGGPFGPPLQL